MIALRVSVHTCVQPQHTALSGAWGAGCQGPRLASRMSLCVLLYLHFHAEQLETKLPLLCSASCSLLLIRLSASQEAARWGGRLRSSGPLVSRLLPSRCSAGGKLPCHGHPTQTPHVGRLQRVPVQSFPVTNGSKVQ